VTHVVVAWFNLMIRSIFRGEPGCGVVGLHIDGMPVMLECVDYEGTLRFDNVQMGGNRDPRKPNPVIQKRILTRDCLSAGRKARDVREEVVIYGIFSGGTLKLNHHHGLAIPRFGEGKVEE
jgi:hypothetical protein